MFLVLGICLVFVLNGVNGAEEMMSDKLVVNLQLLIQYLNDNPNEIDWDTALFGRMALDQLNAFLSEIKKDCDINVPEFNKGIDIMKNISIDLDGLVNRSVDAYSKAKPEHFKLIEFLLKPNFWNKFMIARDINRQFVYPADKLNILEISRESSVTCLHEWIDKNCVVTDFCWDLLTGENHVNRYILHQIVYLLVGEFGGCSGEIEKRAQVNKKNSDLLLKEFCSNSWLEFEKLLVSSKGFTFKGDILHKMGVCGIAGFHHFFPDEWIEKLIASQNPAGYYVICTESELNNAIKEKNQQITELCQQRVNSLAIIALQQAIRYSLEPDLYISCERWNISH